jgi:hypothetical protein
MTEFKTWGFGCSLVAISARPRLLTLPNALEFFPSHSVCWRQECLNHLRLQCCHPFSVPQIRSPHQWCVSMPAWFVKPSQDQFHHSVLFLWRWEIHRFIMVFRTDLTVTGSHLHSKEAARIAGSAVPSSLSCSTIRIPKHAGALPVRETFPGSSPPPFIVNVMIPTDLTALRRSSRQQGGVEFSYPNCRIRPSTQLRFP